MEEDFKKGNHIKSHLYMYSDQLLFKSVRPGVFLACDLLKHSLLVLLLFSLMLTFFCFQSLQQRKGNLYNCTFDHYLSIVVVAEH